MSISSVSGALKGLTRVSPESIAPILRLIRTQGRQHARRYALVFACMLVLAACTAAPAYLFGQGVNEAYLNRDVTAVAWLCLITVGVYATKGLAAYWQAVSLARIMHRIIADNQRLIFEKLVSQPVGFYSDRHSSQFAAAMTHGPLAAASTLNVLIVSFGRDLVSVLVLLTMMLSQAPFLTVIAVIVLPVAVVGVRNILRRARRIAHRQYEGSASILQILQDTLRGYKIVKTFNLETEMTARVGRSIAAIEKASNDYVRVSNRASPSMEALGGIGVALILMHAAYAVLVLNQQPGQIISFIAAFLLAYEPAKRLARLSVDLNASSAGLRDLYSILDLAPEPDDSKTPALAVPRGRVEFDNVSFAYQASAPVLTGLSFCAEPGQVTALVGPSGAGKTTVLNLILRLYENYDGVILIDGQDIRNVSRASLRSQISYVGQETFLFPGSVRENIEKGRPGASEAEIIAAAKAAYAHDFISALPNGYDTPVGENGVRLSGGERQRIAIARALVRDAKIILLDEPASGLDGEAEHSVRAALAHLLKDRTTILIAHGLYSVAHARKIYVMDKGALVEHGDHAGLLGAKSRYRHIFQLQQAPRLTASDGPS